MASGFTTTTSLAELIPEITERVDFIFQDRAIGQGLVTFKDISNQPGKIAEWPIYTEVSASTGASETATPTSHQMDISMATATVAKRSVYVGLGDLTAVSMADPVSSVAQAMGMAKAKAIDASIFNVITTTNYATSAGSTDQSMSITYALNALNALELNEVDTDIHCVLHPFQYKSIRSALTPVANDDGVSVGAANSMTNEAFVSRMLGMNWFVTNRVSMGERLCPAPHQEDPARRLLRSAAGARGVPLRAVSAGDVSGAAAQANATTETACRRRRPAPQRRKPAALRD